MEPPKKISFSFSKSSKPIIVTKKLEKKPDVELIDCLEGQSIKLKNAVEEIKVPLIIPLRDDAKDLLDRVRHAKLSKTQKLEVGIKPDTVETLDELAARELIKEATEPENNTSETKVHTLPVAANKSVVENDQESTLNDYENIPINDFGLAVLRGMGWTESTGIGKHNRLVIKTIEPELRPRGMGLGANKIVDLKKITPAVDKDGKELTLIKGACAKIIAGKNNGDYCEVLGLDDESGRIIVKTTIKKVTLSLNEFMVTPVTKEEYIKWGTVINNATYEEHKEGNSYTNKRAGTASSEYKKSDYKSAKRRERKSNSSEELSRKSTSKHKEPSSEEGSYTPKQKDRSESPYSYSKRNTEKSRHRSASPYEDSNRKRNKSNHRKRSRSPETKSSSPHRKHRSSKKNYDSDVDKYSDEKHNGSKSRKTKKKKSKKSKKYHNDSRSNIEEESKKKKSKKSKKYSSDSSTSDDDKHSRSKTKNRSSKNYR